MIHIGKVVKGLVEKKGLSITEFANKINTSRRNVYRIFENPTVDTGLLVKISKVLEQNLFMNYVAESDIAHHKSINHKIEELHEMIDGLHNKLQEATSKKKKGTTNKKRN